MSFCLVLCDFVFIVCPLYSFFFLMIRRPPRSTLDRSSAASDVYKRQVIDGLHFSFHDARVPIKPFGIDFSHVDVNKASLAGYELAVIGDSITAHLEQFSLRERSGFRVDQLTGIANVSGSGSLILNLTSFS